MVGSSQRTESIQKFILDNVSFHPADIVKVVAQKFAISRQAAARHLKKLTNLGHIEIEGNTSGRIYRLSKGRITEYTYALKNKPRVESVWNKDVLPLLQSSPDNVLGLWKFCFTEIFVNRMAHSKGNTLKVKIIQKKSQSTIDIADDGIGIFHSIKQRLKLSNDKDAAVELANRTMPITPKGNADMNILLSAQMTDSFSIHSRRIVLSHQADLDWDWTLDRSDEEISGTLICMIIRNDTTRTMEQVISRYNIHEQETSPKTCVPIKFMDYSVDALFSRSIARRVLSGVDKFKIAVLDFFGVKEIGPAFADQIFRVFSSKHPNIQLRYINANKQVEAIIQEAKKYSSRTV